MLQRGHSDFAWFHERAQSFQSDSLSAYTEMASSTVEDHAQLNPEPSQQEERAEHNLPPKSYAEAVNKEPTGQNGQQQGAVNGSADTPVVNGLTPRQRPSDEKVIYEKHVN